MPMQETSDQKPGPVPRLPDFFYRKDTVPTRPHPLRVRCRSSVWLLGTWEHAEGKKTFPVHR